MLYCCGRKMLGGWRKRGRQRIGVSGAWGLITGWAPGKPTLSMKPVAIRRDSVMSYEDVTRDPCRALAYCQGVVEILQNHYLAWCKSAVSQGNTELAVQNLDLVESCCDLLQKTIDDSLKKVAKGTIP